MLKIFLYQGSSVVDVVDAVVDAIVDVVVFVVELTTVANSENKTYQ